MLRAARLAPLAASLLVAACSSTATGESGGSATAPEPDAGTPGRPTNVSDVPIDGVTADLVERFDRGDELFDLALYAGDGLGPLYTRTACSSCHDGAARGPGSVQKMSVVEADGVTPASAETQEAKLPWGHTVHPLLAGGATTPIVPPDDPSIRVTTRVGPPVLGRGWMEAVADAEIERVAAAQAAGTDGVRGRVNRVAYASQSNPDARFHQHQPGDRVLGRFGVKARIATLDDFTADALQGDMGITSPLRPTEIPNPDGLTDDAKPGVDVTADSVNLRADYMRLIAIPPRASLEEPRGAALFDQTGCATCHVPSMRTRDDHPFAVLAGRDARIFTDLLLHDMGDGLSDSVVGVDGDAGPRDFRTAPLIGIRFSSTFLHDGRATSVEDAILQHDGEGSEAGASIARFRALSEADRAALVAWVTAL